MLEFFMLLTMGVGCAAYWYSDELKRLYWQRKLNGVNLSDDERAFLERVMPIYRNMTDSDRSQLERQVVWFLHNISFLGRDGLVVTDVMKLVIAANACLLVLKKPWPLFPNVKQVLLYPSAYYASEQRRDSAGLVAYHDVVRQGESWPGGTLVLSWHDVVQGCKLPEDGHNLVFHEFAHQLDQQTGSTTGTPALPNKSMYAKWAREFSRAFNMLKTNIAYGMPNTIHQYGATNEAEFFAVVTETFLEKPDELNRFDASIFNLLCDYYEFDPRQWYLK